MDAIFADDIFKCIFIYKNDRIPNKISTIFAPGSPIDNKAALIQVAALRRTGAKRLPESMMTHVSDTYMRHYGRQVSTIETN